MAPDPVTLRVAAVQMATEPGNRRSNLSRAEALVAEAAGAGAQLVVLPELFHCGYSYDLAARAACEPIDGVSGRWMHELARRHGIWLAGCLYELDAGRCFDTFLLIGPEGERHAHRKRVPSSFEGFFFEGGRDPVVVETPLGRVGLVVCHEAMVSSILAETVAARPDLILFAFSSPMTSPRLARLLGGPPVDMVRRLCVRWARACGAPVVAACVRGRWESRLPYLGFARIRLPFSGQSGIHDPTGAPVASLGQEEAVVCATIAIGSRTPVDGVPDARYVEPVPALVGWTLRVPARLGALSYERWRRRSAGDR